MNTRASRLVLAGVLGLGGLTTGMVIAPAVAQAQASDTSTATVLGERVSRFTDALAGLVTDGTLTQDQASRVATTLAEELPRGGHLGRHGGGRHLDTAATALGVTEDELRTALQGGQSLADVAEAEGVELTTLIDALVADHTARLDAAVAAGDLTQAQADARTAEVRERVTAQVERAGLPGRGGHGPGRGHGPDADDEATADDEAAETPAA